MFLNLKGGDFAESAVLDDNDVTAGFTFRPAIPVSEDSAGKNQQIVVPFDRPVNLLVSSSFFRVSNGSGVALPKTGTSMPVTAQSGQHPPSFWLTVTAGGGQ